jgi:two-component system nitrate/nitrite response regulator NarL
MKRKVATLLVVPKTLLREGLARLLSSTDYKPARSLTSLAEIFQGTPIEADKTLFIISRDAFTKADHDEPLHELRMIKEQNPDSRVLVLSDAFNVDDVVAALRAGAIGYIMSTLTSDALIKSLDLVMIGETVLASEFSRAVCESRRKTLEVAASQPSTTPSAAGPGAHEHAERENGARRLSSREAAILSRLMRGDSNKNIARGIGVAEATVKTHIKAILRKIRVKNRTQAALWAVSNLPQPLDAAPQQNGLANGSIGHD